MVQPLLSPNLTYLIYKDHWSQSKSKYYLMEGGLGWGGGGGGGYPIVNLNEQVKKRQACFRPEITIFCSFTSLRVIVKVK